MTRGQPHSAFTDHRLPTFHNESPSSVTSTSSRRGGGAPPVSQYGWSHRTYPSSPPRYNGTCHTRRQRNMAPSRPPSSFHPFRQPFQCLNQRCPRSQSLNRQAMRRKATTVQTRPVSSHHNEALQVRYPPLYLDNTPWHRHRYPAPRIATPIPTQRIQPSHQPSPSTPGTGYGPPPGPPPSHSLSRHRESFPAHRPVAPRLRRMRSR
jgi:hypothetical protein